MLTTNRSRGYLWLSPGAILTMFSTSFKASANWMLAGGANQDLFCLVKWTMVGIVMNMITCASGVPRDLGGVSSQLVFVGTVIFGNILILMLPLPYCMVGLLTRLPVRWVPDRIQG